MCLRSGGLKCKKSKRKNKMKLSKRTKKSYSLPKMTDEQASVIQSIHCGSNVIVDSVAGSGKTTCILYGIEHISKDFPDKRIVLLTYSKNLKEESREKLKLLGLNNFGEIHSYHSFCVKYYTHEGMVDDGIISCVKDKLYPIKNIDFDILFLDEVQDMNTMYYEFVCKICADNVKRNIQICIFGDRRQCIFSELKNSDSRFITLADKVFDFDFNPNKEWHKHRLSISHRVTTKMADFLNECMIHEKRVTSVKQSNFDIRYHICDSYSDPYFIIKDILTEYHPGDILIIANTAKKRETPLSRIAEQISDALNIPVYRDTDTDGRTNQKTWNNKVVFTTINKTKGLERKVVVIFGFDDFFEFNRKSATCPDIFYVAATRATERLYIIHDKKNNYLPWLDIKKLLKYAKVTGSPSTDIHHKNPKFIKYSVSSFIEFSESVLLSECIDRHLNHTIEKAPSKSISFKSIIHEKSRNIYEEVSNITGIVVPALFEFMITGEIQFLNISRDDSKGAKMAYYVMCSEDGRFSYSKDGEVFYREDIYSMLNDCFFQEDDEDEQNTALEFFTLCVLQHHCQMENRSFLLNQIKQYDWLDVNKIGICIKRLMSLNIGYAVYEEKMEIPIVYGTERIRMTARVDCLDLENNILYEFKCVSGRVKDEHIMQLAFYMYIYETIKLINESHDQNSVLKEEIENSKYFDGRILETRSKTKYKIFNILTGELISISFNDYNDLDLMIKVFIRRKFEDKREITDEEFLDMISQLKVEYQ